MKKVLLCLFLAAAAQAEAATIIPAAIRGGVVKDGTWDTFLAGTNTGNYLTGYEFNEKLEFRSVFVFDLTGITGPASTAELQLFVPESPYGFLSYDGTETVTFFDLDGSALGPGDPGVATFDDAGAGTAYGSAVLSDADQGLLLKISLNAAGISAINNSLGGLFALGGRITTISDSGLPQYAFGNSVGATAQLAVDTDRAQGEVPEPASAALLGAGLVWLAWRRRAA